VIAKRILVLYEKLNPMGLINILICEPISKFVRKKNRKCNYTLAWLKNMHLNRGKKARLPRYFWAPY